MKHWSLSASTAIALVLSAGSAMALTPEEVWANWKSMSTQGGQTLTVGSETRNGAALEVTGVTSVLTIPDSALVVTATVDKITLTDRGDGTVAVTTSEVIPVTIKELDTTVSQAGAVLELTQKDAVTIVSGTAAAMSTDVTVPTTTVKLTSATDEQGKPVDITFEATATALTGKSLLEPQADGANKMDSSFALENLAITTAGNNPSASESFKGTISLAGVAGSTKGVFLQQDAMQDISAALAAGFEVDTQAKTGALAVDFEFSDSAGPNSFNLAMGGTTLHLKLNKTDVDYGIGLTGGKFAMNSPQAGLPPVDAAFGELAFAVALPVAKSDTPLPFSYMTRLVDVTMSEAIWGMIDPGAQLARDPATLILDVKGTGAWAVDILDPAVQNGEVPMPEVPGTLNSLDLTQLLLKVVGGEVNGTGALTFDNSDLTTFQGFPAPTGKINVNLKGVNALIDKAVAMGFIPEDQVMGLRMGLAMFAKPGAGPDELVSEIEFKNKGLFINGQQVM